MLLTKLQLCNKMWYEQSGNYRDNGGMLGPPLAEMADPGPSRTCEI